MILGPFWCQRDNSWVRFIVEDEKARAEIARTSQDNPQLTTAWEPTEKVSWPTSYKFGEPEVETVFYALKDGVLYSTTGQQTSLQGLIACKYTQSNWELYNIRRGNPFVDLQFEAEPNPIPYQNLPLTPEIFAAKLEQVQVEAERIRMELENKWKQVSKQNIRFNAIYLAAGPNPIMGQDALTLLYNELTKALIDFNAGSFTNCGDYLEALKTIIEDNSNPLHQAIVAAASRTDIERDQGLFDDENLRKVLFSFKKSFFFNLLREEARYLSEQFNIPCEILSAEVLEQREAEQRALREREQFHPIPEEYPQHPQDDFQPRDFDSDEGRLFPDEYDEDGELQRVIDLSFEEAQRAFNGRQANWPHEQNENEDPDFLQAVEASLNQQRHDPDYDQAVQASLAEQQPLLGQIKVAVAEAQRRYQAWYEDTNGTQEIRGRDGWFSRWFFRHGASGQTQARLLNDNVNGAESVDQAIILVNALLTHKNTAYNRHSFSSFLLDELRQIDESAWSAISFKEGSNLYDKDSVTELLAGEDDSPNCCMW